MDIVFVPDILDSIHTMSIRLHTSLLLLWLLSRKTWWYSPISCGD